MVLREITRYIQTIFGIGAGLFIIYSNVNGMVNSDPTFVGFLLMLMGVWTSLSLIFFGMVHYPSLPFHKDTRLHPLDMFTWYKKIPEYLYYWRLGKRDNHYAEGIYYNKPDILEGYFGFQQRIAVGGIIDEHDQKTGHGDIIECINRVRTINNSDEDTKKDYSFREVGDRYEMLEVMSTKMVCGQQVVVIGCHCCHETDLTHSVVFSTKVFKDHRDFKKLPPFVRGDEFEL